MKDYKKYFIINEVPEIVYKALTTAKTIKLWSGAAATFDPKPNTEFSLYNDTLVGQNLHFEEGKEIVQQWYLTEIDKAEDASIVSIKLFPHKKGTSILLEQSNIPDDQYEHLVEGWEQQFMYDLAEFYEGD